MAALNVWTQMKYIPPRGHCNYKQSVLSPKCPCLRFMLHPLKSASSYECDGCSHHASFHSMENKMEDEVRKRWEQEAKDTTDQDGQQQRPKKRPRLLQYNGAASRAMAGQELDELSDNAAEQGSAAGKGRGAARKPRRAAAAKAKGRVTEIMGEDDGFIIQVD
ncbi:hypothetical protein ACEQ8H_005731 [Pleosporales sp. CAS-2024a]